MTLQSHLRRFAIAALACAGLISTGCSAVKSSLREEMTGRSEPWIRVGLATDATVFELASDNDMVLRIREPHAQRERAPRDLGRQLVVTLEGGLSMSGGGSYRESLPFEDTLVVDFRSHPLDFRYLWQNRHYTGRFMVFRNARGTLNIVNILPVERYLAGVVPAEIGRAGSDGTEAVKAQAVAARTYTLYYLGRRAAEGFDVYGTVEDQVYGGLEAEDVNTTALIQATRGDVVTYDGKPVRAMYSADCGGMLAALDEAFPSDPVPYLIPHRDRGPGLGETESFCSQASVYRWKEEWGVEQFADILAQYGPKDWLAEDGHLRGRIVDVRVAERSVSGRVLTLEIETTAGVLTLNEKQIRSTLRRPIDNRPILRSALFKIGVEYDGDTPSKVVAQGAGNGHGVGMCQWGAKGMSSRGFVFEQILAHYYRNTELTGWY